MVDLLGLRLRFLARFLLGTGILLALSFNGLADSHDPTDQPLYEIVAVGRAPGQVILATLASPAGNSKWRFRRIPISPPASVVDDVALSSGGTKALVALAGHSPLVMDLTRPIASIDAGAGEASQHHLPHQFFPYANGGKICLLDDVGKPFAEDCVHAAAAAIHEDGRVLYLLYDGTLTIVSPQGRTREDLPFRVLAGASVRLLAGHRGDAHDFLLLVKETHTGPDGAAASLTTIVDPRAPNSPLGTYQDPNLAALRAMLDFSSATTASAANKVVIPNDAVLETLASNLRSQSSTPGVEWSFYRVMPNTDLYAPVLEFAAKEPDYPSDVNIWEQIKPFAHGASIEDYRAAYRSMGDQRWSDCTYYVRTISYPGTWLIEFWFYYPFDEGKSHPHIHDSEHFFIEVDKLGGTVRNVFASDHDSFVPNNMYSTLVKNAQPVNLPLYATVELAKHAMAPDMDHDGRFTPGVDDNMHPESYAFWGLRDHSSHFNFMMEPYFKSMSLPREEDGRFALNDAAVIFPALKSQVPVDHLACRIEPFPIDPPCDKCNLAGAEAATTYLVDHPDAVRPESIYKPYVLPWREIRIGVGIFDWTEGRGEFSLAYAGDFRHLTGGLLPIPARLALEYGFVPFGRYVAANIGTGKESFYSRNTMYIGPRVERLITNTQGLYFAITPKIVDIPYRDNGGALVPSGFHWQYGGPSYHVGYVMELPSAHKGNLINHIGALINSEPGFPVLFEWRVSLGALRLRGRHDFGARENDRDPYGADENAN